MAAVMAWQSSRKPLTPAKVSLRDWRSPHAFLSMKFEAQGLTAHLDRGAIDFGGRPVLELLLTTASSADLVSFTFVSDDKGGNNASATKRNDRRGCRTLAIFSCGPTASPGSRWKFRRRHIQRHQSIPN